VGFDTGDIVAKSDWIRIPPNATPVNMHKITSVSAARLMGRVLEDIIEGRATFVPQPKNTPQTY
jgi:methionyl-tRNA formyltransferase